MPAGRTDEGEADEAREETAGASGRAGPAGERTPTHPLPLQMINAGNSPVSDCPGRVQETGRVFGMSPRTKDVTARLILGAESKYLVILLFIQYLLIY